MLIDSSFQFIVSSLHQLNRLSRFIGQNIFCGSVLGLKGELGAGKTTFVKGLAHGLRIPQKYRVTSPTFTLINEYIGDIPLFHMDFYRVQSAFSLEENGYWEYIEGNGVCAIEWFDKFKELWPAAFLLIQMEIVSKQKRNIQLTARGSSYQLLLQKIAEFTEKNRF